MGIAPPRLLFLITEDWYFWSHRLDLARAARDAGFEVCLATRIREHGARIEKEGIRLFPIRLVRGDRHPLREAASVAELVGLYRRLQPDIVHHVALKPILYGAVAARLAGVRAVVNAFAGLGHVFIAEGMTARLRRTVLERLLQWALASNGSVTIFQNEEDRALFTKRQIVVNGRTRLIPGTGVDTERFAPGTMAEGVPVIILAARMLWDKGIGEFVDAARLLKQRGVHARFVLVGRVDEDNPARIPPAQLVQWQEQGWVEWWNHRDDMPAVYASAAAVVLPSYREGFPKALVEGASCGRPLIATDVPGCREVVRHGENGLLVPPRNVQALADAIAKLVRDAELRSRMGGRGRAMVVQRFTSAWVAGQTIALYRKLLGRADRPDSFVA
jgi:glycosyltransferase involved in cell wall biosynthesis